MRSIEKIFVPLLIAIIFNILLTITVLPFRVSLLLTLVLLMIYLWIREDIPRYIPGLFPLIFLMPFGYISIGSIAKNYFSDVTFLFFGGMVLALALEKYQLHQWFFQKFIRYFGHTKYLTLLGVIILSVVLSSFISNTATALLLISVLQQTRSPSLLMAMGYGASLGGLATVIGSPVNAIFMNYWNQSHEIPITFINWIQWTFPLMFGGILILWFVLSYFISSEKLIHNMKDNEQFYFQKIHKIIVCLFFCYLLGWSLKPFFSFIPKESIWSLIMAFIIFLIPKQISGQKILNLHDLKKIDWNLLLIFGAGLSFAEAISQSELVTILAKNVVSLSEHGQFSKLFAIVLLMIIFTEFSSNTAAAAIFIPIIAGLHAPLGIPLFPTLFAVTAAASLSFMLPTATPPNAIIFSTKILPLRNMLRAGFVLNILFAVLITFWAFRLPHLP